MAMHRAGSWSVQGQTQTANTGIYTAIPPYPGVTYGDLPILYGLSSQGTPNWKVNPTYTVVQNLVITSGSTAHLNYFMRPLNYSVVTVAGASAGTTITIDKDPGLYTTAANWRWGTTTPKNRATNAIATNDYIAVQLTDGTWFFDKVTVSTLTLTLTTTLPTATGGGIPVGAIVFWFGIQSDGDPRVGAAGISGQTGHPVFEPPVSATTTYYAADGICTTIGPGEPMLFFNANATAASTVNTISGFYAQVK